MTLGSEDIRANEGREDYRTPYTIYDEASTANGRVTSPGYRYLPVHRETYGYSPRAIYSHPSQRPGLSSNMLILWSINIRFCWSSER
jgi:Myofilin